MANDQFFYSKSGFLPYSDGSGFKVTATIEQETETSEPTISFESIWRVPVSEWSEVSKKIERLLDLVRRPNSPQERQVE